MTTIAKPETKGFLDLVKRHGALHTVNIKYGYILLALCGLFVLVRTFSLWYYDRSWRRSGRSTTNRRITHLPPYLTLSLITLTVAILFAIHPHLEKGSVSIKRLGRLSYALIPLDIFLASKPAFFSVDNYLNTIRLHKLVSRLILTLAIFHSIGFLGWYAQHNSLFKLLRPVNFIGFVIFLLGTIMMVFVKPVRDVSYKFFYIYHNFFMLSFIILIYYHARPGVALYYSISLLLVAVQTLRKYVYSKDITMTEIIENPESDYVIIKFPKTLLPEDYLPASHVRIGYSKWNPLYMLMPSHPYTVATIYENRDLLSSLIVKKTRFQIQPFETYSIQANLKSSLSENFFNTAENVNIVCGGSGISFGLPIFEYFKRAILAGGRDVKLKFIWVTRNEADLYILQDMAVQGVDVFVTKSDSDQMDTIEVDAFSEQGIPLSDLSVDDSADSFENIKTKFTNVSVIGKRPDLEAMLEKNMTRTIDYANKWVISCGPASLNRDCERIALTNKCSFFSEEYSF
jgi:NAD(P)H-flavin reductase